MIRTVVLLVLVAYASAIREGGLKVRFANTLLGSGIIAFIELPTSVAAAVRFGWEQYTRPSAPKEYEKLSMYCSENRNVCVLFDDTGYVAGLQIAVNKDKISNTIFDWEVQGFTPWTIETDEKTLNYWTISQYFITPDTLKKDSATRIAQRNNNLMLQDDSILVSGFNGTLYRIPTDVSEITGPNSDFTKQACISWMGQHYYYKMTKELECKADTLFPWFSLVDDGQLIGTGLVIFGKRIPDKSEKNYFEQPKYYGGKAMVPRGPQCLYDLADSPGMITMHIYYIKNPRWVICSKNS